MKRIVTVVGNRPQFVKAAIVARQWREVGLDAEIENILINTGQHYDPMLSDVFFDQLGLPAASYNLEMGSGPILDQIGAMIPKLRLIFEKEQPDGILVFGDTNSTIAAAITAAHLHIPLFHVEAGERNFRRKNAPEEINRIVTDELAWMCLTSTEKARHYLLREGFNRDRAVWVGDPMYDLFVWATEQIQSLDTVRAKDLDLDEGQFVLATIHRAENTSDRARLVDLLEAMDASELPVILPVHPRVKNLLSSWGWQPHSSLRLIEPLSYFDVISLLSQCAMCVTDSGGLAREAFFAGKPSLVPMANSGWNEIVEAGWIKVVPGPGRDLLEQMSAFKPSGARPTGMFGDGRASERIGREILKLVKAPPVEGAWHPLGDFFSIPQPEDRSAFTIDNLELLLKSCINKDARIGYLVEGSAEAPMQIARAHQNAGIVATFVFTADGDLYNLLTPASLSMAKFLIGLGQIVALRSVGGMTLEQLRSVASALEAISGIHASGIYHSGKMHWLNKADPIRVEWVLDHGFVEMVGSGSLPGMAIGKCDWWGLLPSSPFETDQRSAFTRLDVARNYLAANP